MATTKQAKATYQAKYNKRPSAKKKKNEATRARRKMGIPVGSTKDASHKGGKIVPEDRKANRSRGGKKGNKAGKAQGGRNSSRKGVPNKKR